MARYFEAHSGAIFPLINVDWTTLTAHRTLQIQGLVDLYRRPGQLASAYALARKLCP